MSEDKKELRGAYDRVKFIETKEGTIVVKTPLVPENRYINEFYWKDINASVVRQAVFASGAMHCSYTQPITGMDLSTSVSPDCSRVELSSHYAGQTLKRLLDQDESDQNKATRLVMVLYCGGKALQQLGYWSVILNDVSVPNIVCTRQNKLCNLIDFGLSVPYRPRTHPIGKSYLHASSSPPSWVNLSERNKELWNSYALQTTSNIRDWYNLLAIVREYASKLSSCKSISTFCELCIDYLDQEETAKKGFEQSMFVSYFFDGLEILFDQNDNIYKNKEFWNPNMEDVFFLQSNKQQNRHLKYNGDEEEDRYKDDSYQQQRKEEEEEEEEDDETLPSRIYAIKNEVEPFLKRILSSNNERMTLVAKYEVEHTSNMEQRVQNQINHYLSLRNTLLHKLNSPVEITRNKHQDLEFHRVALIECYNDSKLYEITKNKWSPSSPGAVTFYKRFKAIHIWNCVVFLLHASEDFYKQMLGAERTSREELGTTKHHLQFCEIFAAVQAITLMVTDGYTNNVPGCSTTLARELYGRLRYRLLYPFGYKEVERQEKEQKFKLSTSTKRLANSELQSNQPPLKKQHRNLENMKNGSTSAQDLKNLSSSSSHSSSSSSRSYNDIDVMLEHCANKAHDIAEAELRGEDKKFPSMKDSMLSIQQDSIHIEERVQYYIFAILKYCLSHSISLYKRWMWIPYSHQEMGDLYQIEKGDPITLLDRWIDRLEVDKQHLNSPPKIYNLEIYRSFLPKESYYRYDHLTREDYEPILVNKNIKRYLMTDPNIHP